MKYQKTIIKQSRRFTLWLGICLLALVMVNSGCDDDDCCSCPRDVTGPAAPRGLTSTTGDDYVILSWYANSELDLEGYDIWRGTDGVNYTRLATVDAYSDDYLIEYTDYSAHNGTTYYYAVTAFDFSNNESELSLEDAFDTPRPQGDGRVMSHAVDPEESAYDISRDRRVAGNDPTADFIYFANPSIDEYLFEAGPGVWIQDMGYTGTFDDIGWAPGADFDQHGWSPTGIVEAIAGHTYVLLTASDQYAKIWLTSTPNGDRVYFEWALQEDILNQELFVP